MKALPVRFQRQEHTFKDVTFTIQPLTNQLRAHIQTANLQRTGVDEQGNAIFGTNAGGIIFDVIAFSLVEISGLDIEVEYDEVEIGRNKYTRVKDYCLDLLPYDLFDYIKTQATTAQVLLPEESEEVGFMQASSTEISPVPETSVTVVVEPELRSDTPSPITDVSDPPSYADASGSESVQPCDT